MAPWDPNIPVRAAGAMTTLAAGKGAWHRSWGNELAPQDGALEAGLADQPWVADLAEVVTRRRRRSGGGISLFGCCCLLLLAVAAGVVFLVAVVVLPPAWAWGLVFLAVVAVLALAVAVAIRRGAL